MSLTVVIDWDSNLPRDLKALEKNISNVMGGRVGKSLIQQLRVSSKKSIDRVLRRKKLIKTGKFREDLKTRLRVNGGVLNIHLSSRHPAAEILNYGGTIKAVTPRRTKKTGRMETPMMVFFYRNRWIRRKIVEVPPRYYLKAIENDILSHIPRQLEKAFDKLKLGKG